MICTMRRLFFLKGISCAIDKSVGMPLFQTLDGDVYERMQEYFTLFCQSELHSCGITQECFMKILSDATKVSC